MKLRITLLALAVFAAASAQDFPMKRKLADKYYDSFDYIKAIPMYEELLKEYPEDLVIFSRLANSYRKINDSKNAARCYAKLTEQDNLDNLNLLYYAQALARTGNYSAAAEAWERYARAMPADSRGRGFSMLYRNLLPLMKDSTAYRIDRSGLSSDASDFAPAYFRNKLVFASSRKGSPVIRSTYNWTDSPYLDLFTASPDARNAESFSKILNSRYHEGPLTFSKNYDTIIFTRSNYSDRELGRSSEGITKLKLFIATWDKDAKDWNEPEEVPFNSNDYSTGHPALSADGKTLYFASDRPGGSGGTDIYGVSIIPGEGKSKSWGNPVNLGRAINTEGDEMFPFVDNDGSLWFASNGLPGLGGLDVFVARKNAGGFAPPRNPGYKFNTRFDDFAYITKNSGKDGFISSDRNSRTGDDIFRVRRMTRDITVIVHDKETGRPIEGASVSVLQAGQGKAAAVPMGNGLGQTGLASGQAYTFTATAGKYNELKLNLAADKAEATDTLRLAMTRSEAEIFLEGAVLSASSKKPVPGAVARITDITTNQATESRCDENGIFRLELKPGTAYTVSASALAAGNECSSGIAEISTRDITEDGTINRNFPLYCVGDIIEVENIYYDLNKAAIRPEAAAELDKLYGIMMSNPYLKIELRSHTDSRGSASSNMSLSEKRAAAAAEYLYSKGIARDRVVSKGYGESLLLNKCADGVNCSEEEHQVNRRTEFKVLSLK